MNSEQKTKLGSNTAKAGFRNEQDVVDHFNNWKNDPLAKEWLITMGYNLDKIEFIKAAKINKRFKTDVQIQVQIIIKQKEEIDCQNLQVKLVSNPHGFNQIDKRWVKNYAELWNIDPATTQLLKHFTGELPPYVKNPRDPRRMFADEFSDKDRNILLEFFKKNKSIIVTDILKGQGEFSADWMLIILKNGNNKMKWALKPMKQILNFFDGEVLISPKNSFKIGKITIQRKGGDGGRQTANMLQFKINPALLVD